MDFFQGDIETIVWQDKQLEDYLFNDKAEEELFFKEIEDDWLDEEYSSSCRKGVETFSKVALRKKAQPNNIFVRSLSAILDRIIPKQVEEQDLSKVTGPKNVSVALNSGSRGWSISENKLVRMVDSPGDIVAWKLHSTLGRNHTVYYFGANIGGEMVYATSKPFRGRLVLYFTNNGKPPQFVDVDKNEQEDDDRAFYFETDPLSGRNILVSAKTGRGLMARKHYVYYAGKNKQKNWSDWFIDI